MKKAKPLIYDRVILSRVKQYLEENVDRRYVDVNVMAKHLQGRYIEYSRRKIGPFRALVEQAFNVISKSYDIDDTQLSDNDSDVGSVELTTERNPSLNYMSNMMNNLYNKTISTTALGLKPSSGEAIDISSDESDNAISIAKSNGKTLNATSKVIAHKIKTNSTMKVSTNNEQQQQKLSKSSRVLNTLNQGSTNLESANSDNYTLNASNSTMIGKKRTEHNEYLMNEYMPTKKRNLDVKSSDSAQLLHYMKNSMNQFDMEKDEREKNLNPLYLQQHPRQLQQSKIYKKEVQLKKSRGTFHDIGGMEKTLKELCELLMHIKSPEIYFALGLMPPRGILLHGPSGCGKTLLAHAIAGQLNLALIEIPATELVAGISGESEERIRDVFEQAAAYAPCVLFIDDIDAISSNRSLAQKDMERRIVSQLISSLDNLKMQESGQSVLVIGATTRVDILDPALRRVGRFDHEISIGIPTRKDRKDILAIICDGLSIEPKCDFDKIAELTPGYVGADLLALVSRAATIAVKRKCAEQMRAFQLKSQKNITIVDLEDDNEDNNEKNDNKYKEVTKGDHITNEKNEKEKYRESVETVANSPSNDKTHFDKDKDDPEEKEKNDKEIIDKSKKEADQQDIEMTDVTEILENNLDDAKSVEQQNELDNSNDKIAESTEESCNEKVATPIKVQEPTLFELLNWLDNPPDEIAFVIDFCITLSDFFDAIKVVQPLAKREGFITVPDVTWDDVGSLQNIRDELKLAVLAPVKYPDELERLGITAPSGVLLCGPPGCGKTLLAKAIANEAGINFISIKGPELMNMYVGESERAVRACFQRARNSVPCVIFFDEFDSLCPKRSDGSGDNSSSTRVVNQLLTEMDGVEDRQGVYILAATNRPDIIDPAVLRPGRLDTVLYVGLPEEADRVAILQATTKNRTRPLLHEDVDFEEIAKSTNGYTGADLAGLVRQAAMLALKESLKEFNMVAKDLCVKKQHFQQAIQLLRPSISDQDRKIYDRLRLKYASPSSLILDT